MWKQLDLRYRSYLRSSKGPARACRSSQYEEFFYGCQWLAMNCVFSRRTWFLGKVACSLIMNPIGSKLAWERWTLKKAYRLLFRMDCFYEEIHWLVVQCEKRFYQWVPEECINSINLLMSRVWELFLTTHILQWPWSEVKTRRKGWPHFS